MTTTINIQPNDLWESISSVRTHDDADKVYTNIKVNREITEEIREAMIDALVFDIMMTA